MITEKQLITYGFRATYLPEDSDGNRVTSEFEYVNGKVLVGLAEGKNYVRCLSSITNDLTYACYATGVKDIIDVSVLCNLINGI